MKLAFTTDWHLTDKIPGKRNPETFLAYQTKKVDTLLKMVSESGAEMLFHGGDFFDTYKPSIYFLNSILDIIQKYKVPTVMALGNHDIPGYNLECFNAESVIGILNRLKYVKVLENIYDIDMDLVKIRFIPIQKKHDINMYNVTSNKPIICVTHNSISNVSLPYEHILCDDFKGRNFINTLFFCGHIHAQFDVSFAESNVQFLNPGCLIRTSISEKDIIPRFYIIDVQKDGWTIEKVDLGLNLENSFIETGFSITSEKAASFDSFIGSLNQHKLVSLNLENYISGLEIEQDVKNELLRRVRESHA